MNKNNFYNRIFKDHEPPSLYESFIESSDIYDNESQSDKKIKDEYKLKSPLDLDKNQEILFEHENVFLDPKFQKLLEDISFDSIYLSQKNSFEQKYVSHTGNKWIPTINFYSLIFFITLFIGWKFFITLTLGKTVLFFLPILIYLFLSCRDFFISKRILQDTNIHQKFYTKFIFKFFKIKIPFFKNKIDYKMLEKNENFQKLYNFFKNRPEEEALYYFKEYMQIKCDNHNKIDLRDCYSLEKFGLYINDLLEKNNFKAKPSKHKTFEQLEQEAIQNNKENDEQNLNFFEETSKEFQKLEKNKK